MIYKLTKKGKKILGNRVMNYDFAFCTISVTFTDMKTGDNLIARGPIEIKALLDLGLIYDTEAPLHFIRPAPKVAPMPTDENTIEPKLS